MSSSAAFALTDEHLWLRALSMAKLLALSGCPALILPRSSHTLRVLMLPSIHRLTERTIRAIFQSGGTAALLILGETGAQSGLADVQDAPDKPVSSPFAMHPKRERFASAVRHNA